VEKCRGDIELYSGPPPDDWDLNAGLRWIFGYSRAQRQPESAAENRNKLQRATMETASVEKIPIMYRKMVHWYRKIGSDGQAKAKERLWDYLHNTTYKGPGGFNMYSTINTELQGSQRTRERKTPRDTTRKHS
jgi:hypothetical protein